MRILKISNETSATLCLGRFVSSFRAFALSSFSPPAGCWLAECPTRVQVCRPGRMEGGRVDFKEDKDSPVQLCKTIPQSPAHKKRRKGRNAI